MWPAFRILVAIVNELFILFMDTIKYPRYFARKRGEKTRNI